MDMHHLRMGVSFLLAASLTACGGGGGGSSLPPTSGVATIQNTAASRTTLSASSTAVATAAYKAIDAGGSAAGNWIADTGFSGGATATATAAINTSNVTNPAPQAVYQSQRYAANLTYTVPNLTPNAAYNVRLHFVESFFGSPGQRVFSVKINGTQVLTNFDIYAAAGGSNIAVVKSYSTNADSTGKISLALTASVNNASIAGIEVTAASSTSTPTPTPTTVPTAAPAGSVAAVDAGGAAAGNWRADTDNSGGWVAPVQSAAIDTHLVSNPAPQAVYQSQRTGTSFTYTIPNLSANGAYTVRLHFVESWFSSAGQRVFNVSFNGAQQLSNFDIFASAGGQNVAIVKAFSVKADATGAISIAFAATTNNATVSGIEVLGGSTSATPVPVQSNAPSPTPTPTAAPAPTAPGGTAWPAPGWVPYPNSPLTVPVAPNPTYTAGSAGIINAMWGGSPTDDGRLEVSAGPPPPDSQDYSQPLYFGHAGDPQYTVSCSMYGGGCPASGATVHIPKGAYPAGGTDHHLSVRDLVTGKDVMLWLAPVPSGSGGTISVGWGTVISSSGNGLDAIGGTASGMSALWQLRETDLAHNTINHALIVQINGESSDGYVYPANGWDNGYFHADPWPMMGAHFWLDVGPPYAAGCPQYAVSYLTALHKYGAYQAENGAISSPMEAIYESDLSYTYNGGASMWGQLMQSLGGKAVGHSVVQMTSCGINMQQHMHVLSPPSVI